jgi:UDP-glucose 4-epimerase
MHKEAILVTGGAGFIGSHIVDKLVKLGYFVVVVDDLSCGKKRNINTKAKFYKIRLQEKKLKKVFRKYKFSYVFHLAAQKNVRTSVLDPIKDAQDNIIGSLNLLENCRKYKIKKIIFSSTGGAIYGEAKKIPTPEGYQEFPISPYGVAKLAIEKYLHYYEQVHKMHYVSLRYANVFGPRQDPEGEAGVVAIFISKLLNDKHPIINGNGKQTRDYIYVDDVVNANMLAMKKNVIGIYNIGTAKETNVNQLFKKITGLMKFKAVQIHGPALVGEQMRSCLDIRKINKVGFKINYNLEQGLKETINWFNHI